MKDLSKGAKQAGGSRFLVPGVFILFCALAFLLYLPALPGPFIMDDGHNIVSNWHIRVENLSPGSLIDAGLKGPSKTRPLPKITFAINHYFSGYDARAFRAVNVFFHALAAFGLFLFLFALSKTPGMKGRQAGAFGFAFGASLLWLVHPLATMSVNYIVQRMAVMAALFFIFSLYFFVRARLAEGTGPKRLFFCLCGFSGILALLSKENAAMLLLVLPLIEWYFFQDLSFPWLKRALRWILPTAAFFVVILLIYTGFKPLEVLGSAYEMRDFTPYERVLTQFRVLVLYLSLIILPVPGRFNLYRDFDISRSLLDPSSTLASLALLAGLFAFALFAAKKMPLVSFAILFFFITLAPESSFIGLEIAFDHRTYLPSMMLVAAIVWGVWVLLSSRKKAFFAVLSLFALLAVWGSFSANRVWGDNIAFAQDAVKKSPQMVRPWLEQAKTFAMEGRYAEAIASARHATQLDPSNLLAWVFLGKILAQPEVGRFEAAVKAYKSGLKYSRDSAAFKGQGPEAGNDLHLILAMLGRFEEAGSVLKDVLSKAPEDPQVLLNAGRHMVFANRPEMAIAFLRHAKKLDPQNTDIDKALEEAQKAVDELDNIDRLLERLNSGLEKNPRDASILDRMGSLYRRKGDFAKAVEYHQKALALAPYSPEIHNNLGLAYMATGDFDKARKMLEKALELDPASIPALYNLTGLHSRLGNLDMAGEFFNRLVETGFDDFDMIEKDFNMENLRLTQIYRAARDLSRATGSSDAAK